MIYNKRLPALFQVGFPRHFVDRHAMSVRNCSYNDVASLILRFDIWAIEIRDNLIENYLEIDLVDISRWLLMDGGGVVAASLAMELLNRDELADQKIPMDLDLEAFLSSKMEKAADLYYFVRAFECMLPLFRENDGLYGLAKGEFEGVFASRINPVAPWARTRIESCLD